MPFPEPVPALLFTGVTALGLRISLVFTVALLKAALRKKAGSSRSSVFETVMLQVISLNHELIYPRLLGSENPDAEGLKRRISRLVVTTRWLAVLGIGSFVWGVGHLLTVG